MRPATLALVSVAALVLSAAALGLRHSSAPGGSSDPDQARPGAAAGLLQHSSRSSRSSSRPECDWTVLWHDNVSAWEQQVQPHRHKVRDRGKAIARLEALLRKLSSDRGSNITFVEGSRWMAVFREVVFSVSTRHGHPLRPRDERERHSRPFPWKGWAYLRLRQYKVLVPAGAYVPTAMPGMADLTFKMKAVDPDHGPGELQLPETVGGSKLTAKLEWDGHCDHGRTSMSPLFKPVSQGLNISRLRNVERYYPNLPQVSRLDPDEPLPFGHVVFRAKVVWVVLFNGVVGEANLVIKYNTTLDDAVAGLRPKNGEVSLRIRRQTAEATGTTGEEGKRQLRAALDTVGRGMQALRDAGWDGKTPALPGRGASSTCSEGSVDDDERSAPDDGCGCSGGWSGGGGDAPAVGEVRLHRALPRAFLPPWLAWRAGETPRRPGAAVALQ